jgi:predicted permease
MTRDLHPDWSGDIKVRLSPLRLSPTREAEIVEELSQHLDDRYRELIAGGVAPDDAVLIARADFQSDDTLSRHLGALRQSRAPLRIAVGEPGRHLLNDLCQDARYGLRSFRRQPAFTIAAVLAIALGVGANSAIFSVVRAVLLESLPFRNADRLYRLRMVYPDGAATTTLSAPDFMSIRAMNRTFERVEAYTSGRVTMLGGGDPVEVRVVSVSDGLFDMLGVSTSTGRAFVVGEHAPGRNRTAVLDHGFWRRSFGGDELVLGKSIVVGGASYSIVGVLARGQRLPADVPGARVPSDADVYLPIEYGEAFNANTGVQRRSNYLAVLATARPGVGAALVDEDVRRIAGELQAAYPGTNASLSMNAIPARDLIVGDLRRPLLMLFAAVGFVLLIACANVASLMLARGSARGDELAVRAALGARRGRLLRQLLTEAVLLGLVGGTLGLAIAYAGIRALVAAQPADIPRLDEIALERTVVLFTLAVTLVASLIFGALPALQSTSQVGPGLGTSRRGGGADRKSRRMRAGLVVAEVALAVVLLAGAGLMLRSLFALTGVTPGFIAANATSFRIALFGRGYDLDRVRARVDEFETELRRLPGVGAVGATSTLPMSGPGPRLAFSVVGAPPPAANVNREIGVTSVTPTYLKTIGARFVTGRDFDDRDRPESPMVAIVNEAAVRRWFPDGRPIGRQVEVSGRREIVGVISDVLQGDPKQEPAPQLFVPYSQRPSRSVSFVVRSTGDLSGLTSSILGVGRRLDPAIAVSTTMPLEQLHAAAMARPLFYASLLALFAAAALTLAITGIFGVTCYAVAERRREIGIRLALGATAAGVLRAIVGRAVGLAMFGAAFGLVVVVLAGRVIQSQLHGVTAFDPATFAVVVLLLVTSAAAASFLPARRASQVDPNQTLRGA